VLFRFRSTLLAALLFLSVWTIGCKPVPKHLHLTRQEIFSWYDQGIDQPGMLKEAARGDGLVVYEFRGKWHNITVEERRGYVTRVELMWDYMDIASEERAASYINYTADLYCYKIAGLRFERDPDKQEQLKTSGILTNNGVRVTLTRDGAPPIYRLAFAPDSE
jgi:hypothetical protein